MDANTNAIQSLGVIFPLRKIQGLSFSLLPEQQQQQQITVSALIQPSNGIPLSLLTLFTLV